MFAAGTYNTQKLLHRLRAEHAAAASPPGSAQLTRTNSESLLGAVIPAPGRRLHPRRGDHVVVASRTSTPTSSRCGTAGAATRWVCSTTAADRRRHPAPPAGGNGSGVRAAQSPADTRDGRPCDSGRSGRSSAGHAVAGQLDHRAAPARPARLAADVQAGRRRAQPDAGSRPANQAARAAGRRTSAATPVGSWGDLINMPMTAHFIGGCPIGDSPATGVIDPYHRLYGYRGLHVVDGVGAARRTSASTRR